MRDFLDNTFLLALLFSITFLITAAILYFFPRKRINHFYGYRTPLSIRSQERWNFSQKYFSVQMTKAAVAVIIISFFGSLLPKSETMRLFGSVFIVFAAITYMYSTTESALRKRFIESKN